MSAAPWDQYWRSGQKHSCFSRGEPVAHRAFWNSFFAACPRGARVLDLACGAGAVASIARDAARGFEITGADFSTEIAPVEGIRFVQGARLENLPLPDASFDVVVSQYGFEYADAAAATPELVRVLAPGGEVALIVHAQEGPPVQDILGRLARARRMLAADGLADLVLRLGEALAVGAPADDLLAAAEAARAVEAKADHDPTTRRVLGILSDALLGRRMFGGAYVRDTARGINDELQQYATRIAAMTEAALSEPDAAALALRLQSLGLAPEPVVAAHADNGDLAGWLVRARRF